MVCVQVLANDVAIGMAAASCNFELNVYKPLIASAFLQSARVLGDACASFELRCARGIEPDREAIRAHLERSLMLVTALTPRLGYDNAAKIAKHAHATGTTLREASIALGVLSGEEFDAEVDPAAMVRPTR